MGLAEDIVGKGQERTCSCISGGGEGTGIYLGQRLWMHGVLL